MRNNALLINFVCFAFLLISWKPDEKGWKPASKEDVTALFNKVNNWLSISDYYMAVKHQSFLDYTSGKAMDQSDGFYIKIQKNYHSYLLGVHTIQNDKFRVVVDSLNKFLMVSNPSERLEQPFEKELVMKILESCESVMKMKNNTDTHISISLKNGEVKKYEFVVDDQFHLKKIAIFYNRKIEISEQEKSPTSKPRVEILFSEYKALKPGERKNEFEISKYIEVHNNKITPSKLYASYTVKDLRVFK